MSIPSVCQQNLTQNAKQFFHPQHKNPSKPDTKNTLTWLHFKAIAKSWKPYKSWVPWTSCRTLRWPPHHLQKGPKDTRSAVTLVASWNQGFLRLGDGGWYLLMVQKYEEISMDKMWGGWFANRLRCLIGRLDRKVGNGMVESDGRSVIASLVMPCEESWILMLEDMVAELPLIYRHLNVIGFHGLTLSYQRICTCGI